MAFVKYTSIDNVPQVADEFRKAGYAQKNEIWIAREKVHGANCSFAQARGGKIIICRRNGEVDDDFYNYKDAGVLDNLLPKVEKLFKDLFAEHSAESISLYGEYFGGAYWNSDMEMITGENATCIQKGVFYSPDNHFNAFDIILKMKDFRSFLPIYRTIRLCEDYDIPVLPILHEGTMDDMISLNPTFTSTIPGMLGNQPVETNIAEGFVLCPILPHVTKRGRRVIIKHKAPAFSEVKPRTRMPKSKVEFVIPDEIADEVDIARQYITINRYHNVVSKLSSADKENFAKTSGLLVKDALEEYIKDHPDIINKKNKKIFTKVMQLETDVVLEKF